MDDPNITIEEYIRIKEEKTRRRGKVYNWETATYSKIWDNEDVYDLGSVETEFPAIVFNDTLTSEAALSCEPTVSSLNNDKIDFRISFDKSDDEDYLENDNDKVDIEHSSRDLSVKPLPDVINTDVGAYALGINTAYLGEWIQRIDFLYSFRPRERISTNIGGEFTNLEILKCWSLETSRRLFNTRSCS
ncbi:hypothetical protein Tco_0745085 [Tanacetum coccineum]